MALSSACNIRVITILRARAPWLRAAVLPVRYMATEPSPKHEKPKPVTKVNKPISSGTPITWKSLIIGGSIMGIITAWFLRIKEKKKAEIEKERCKSFGRAAIGGSFELVDATGKLRKSEEFLGEWVLIYFGFTHCPDVCPEELEKLSKAVETLTEAGLKINPIFISVDPERDTPELVDKYLREFSNKFIGLTGTKEQVEQATRAYRVYYSVGPKDKDNDYIVDHTIISYLINPKGELADYFGQTKSSSEIEMSIMLAMKTYKG